MLTWNESHFSEITFNSISISNLQIVWITVVWKNPKKSHCERSELCLHFEWTKVNQKCQKWSILTSFWKPEVYGQTVLPDRSLIIEQKLVEKCKNWKLKNATF